MSSQTLIAKKPRRACGEGHQARDAAALLGRGQDPDRVGACAKHDSIAELQPQGRYRPGAHYYTWSKEFMEAKRRLAGIPLVLPRPTRPGDRAGSAP